jgi:hypothetical protein
MPKDGHMMSLDNFDRFWSVRIDGQGAKVMRANYTFKSVYVPGGNHVVEWIYNPYPVKIAWACFYLMLLLFIGHLVGLKLLWSFAIAVVLLVIAYAATGAVVRHAGAETLSGGAVACESGRLQLRSAHGKRYPVTTGLAGSVEGIFQEPGASTKIIGWAVDEVAKAPPRQVVVTLGDAVWLEISRFDYRRDIAELNPGYSRSGFAAIGRGAGSGDVDQIRLFALLADGSARELQYWKDRKTRPPKCPS